MDKNKLNGKSVTKESLQCLREKKKKVGSRSENLLIAFFMFFVPIPGK